MLATLILARTIVLPSAAATVEAPIDPNPVKEEPKTTVLSPQKAPGEQLIAQLVQSTGRAKNLSEWQINAIIQTIRCESGFVPQQSRIVKDGVREPSFGIVQIHLPSNPGITEEQAMDIPFSVNFIVEKFAKGEPFRWTCYRQIFGS